MDKDKFRREYYNPSIKNKVETTKPAAIENKVSKIGFIIIFLVLISVAGYFISSYKKTTALEESELQVGQIWTEKIIQQSIYTLQPETLVVKKEIINLEDNIVYYHQEEPETTYTFYQADYHTFKENSTKIKN